MLLTTPTQLLVLDAHFVPVLTLASHSAAVTGLALHVVSDTSSHSQKNQLVSVSADTTLHVFSSTYALLRSQTLHTALNTLLSV